MKTRYEVTSSKSYVKREALEKKLEALGATQHRHVICRNAEGRWTAIFVEGNALWLIHEGFMVLF